MGEKPGEADEQAGQRSGWQDVPVKREGEGGEAERYSKIDNVYKREGGGGEEAARGYLKLGDIKGEVVAGEGGGDPSGIAVTDEGVPGDKDPPKTK